MYVCVWCVYVCGGEGGVKSSAENRFGGCFWQGHRCTQNAAHCKANSTPIEDTHHGREFRLDAGGYENHKGYHRGRY